MSDKCSLNEARNYLGNGKCRNDGECKGFRTCVLNECTGNDGCITKGNKSKCAIDESSN